MADYIREFFTDRRVWMIYGTMRDKSVEEILDTLFPLAHEVIAAARDLGWSARMSFPDGLRQTVDWFTSL